MGENTKNKKLKKGNKKWGFIFNKFKFAVILDPQFSKHLKHGSKRNEKYGQVYN